MRFSVTLILKRNCLHEEHLKNSQLSKNKLQNKLPGQIKNEIEEFLEKSGRLIHAPFIFLDVEFRIELLVN